MKAYAIVIKGNEVSEKGYEKLLESYLKHNQEFSLKKFNAITHKNVDSKLE